MKFCIHQSSITQDTNRVLSLLQICPATLEGLQIDSGLPRNVVLTALQRLEYERLVYRNRGQWHAKQQKSEQRNRRQR